MRLPRSLMSALLIAASLAPVSSCASRERVTPIFPPSADLKPEPKPRLDPAVLALCHRAGIDPAECSDAALTAHDDRVESWGERRDAAVARICRWAVENGAQLTFECPDPPATP